MKGLTAPVGDLINVKSSKEAVVMDVCNIYSSDIMEIYNRVNSALASIEGIQAFYNGKEKLSADERDLVMLAVKASQSLKSIIG